MKLIYSETGKYGIDKKIFTALLRKLDKIPETEVELLITDNDTIRLLNLNYRGKDSATDVLSFAERESPDPDPALLGQVIISIERAREQAAELRQSLEEELRFLFVHGILHILGYDHEKPEDEKIMLAKAYKILGRT